MSNSGWRFKRSFLDPKNGEIRLYYTKPCGNTAVLMSSSRLSTHVFPNLPTDVQMDAQQRIKELV